MPINACTNQYFQNGNQLGFSIGIIRFTPVTSFTMKAQKPFIPLYPVRALPTVGDIRFTITDIISFFSQVPLAMANDMLAASTAYVNNAISPAAAFVSGNYASYLYKNVFNPETLDRFKYIYTLLFKTITDINPASTEQQADETLMRMIDNIITSADKRLFLPPGEWLFKDAGETTPLINQLIVEEATFSGVAVLEIDSII